VTTESESPALELRSIVKHFGMVAALEHADLVVGVGRVHALLGENGAGKSTLMRIAYGLIHADDGMIRIFGRELARHHVREASALGVGMVHQHLSLVPNLTVLENLVLGERGSLDLAEARRRLSGLSERSGLRVPMDALARDLSIVEQQRLEILKALARGARLLILDEPTAVLAPAEVDDLLRWVRQFASGGGSVVIVTHKLREALTAADDVTVLRRGHVVHSGQVAGNSEGEIARAIFPEPLEESTAADTRAPGETVVMAADIAVLDARGARRIQSASFQICRHEIIGVAAVEGSGHRDLLGALAGLRPVAAGTLRLPTRIALIPADRRRDALIPEFTLAENVALRGAGARRGIMVWRELVARTSAILARFSVLAPSARARAQTLSGGNQQRLVVGRELEEEVDLLIADNPTRGLDIRASDFVHRQLRDAASQGAAVVVHSSDLDEVLSLATRAFVVFDGSVREVVATRDVVGRAMLGVA